MHATEERLAPAPKTTSPSNLSEFVTALEALRKRETKLEKSTAKAAQATAQIEAACAAAEETAKARVAAVIAAWTRGKSELTDAERRRLDDEERRIMANACDFDITAEELPTLKAQLQHEAKAMAEEWRSLRQCGRHLALENIEQSIEHHKSALDDPRTRMAEIEQHLMDIRDLCGAGEFFRNSEQGRIPLLPRKTKSDLDGKIEWTDQRGDPGAIADKHGVEGLIDEWRKIAKVNAEVDRKRAWQIVCHYTNIGVPIYSREERELERKVYVSPSGAHTIRSFISGKFSDNAQGTWAASMRRRIAEIEEATSALQALRAQPL